jgi:thiamine-phosphate pyrophosphorylase
MPTSLLSPGAQRVMDRLAARESCTAFDLLEALWADESRAHDLLSGVGVSAGAMREAAVFLQHADSPVCSLQELLQSARQLVAHEGMAAEIRTEHLLLAGLEIDSFRQGLELMSVDTKALRTRLQHPFTEITTPLESGIQLRAAPVLRSESVSVARILDASANRCREGLRVVEDYARMILNDAHLSRQIKETRHALVPLLSRLHMDDAVQARDTEHDVGTSIHTAFEMARPSVWSVALANIKRVQEALRTLEEYGKTIDATTAAGIGGLRYRFYTIEKGLSATQGAMEKLKDCSLYLLVTDSLCPQGAGPVVKAALRGGVDVVQLREKGMPDRQFLELAKWIREWTAETGALFLVNDRPDLACLADADGVHVGQGDLTVYEARRIIGGQKLVGVSTHAIEQAEQAVLDGADYLGMGPVFASRTKSFEAFAGLEYVRSVAHEVSLPAFAIGGIGLENVEQVLAAGARRIAVSSQICGADDPERMAVRLKESLRTVTSER